MNIYDFDGTIYDGDSSVDFFKFCIRKNKRCLLVIPRLGLIFIAYKLKFRTKEQLKSVFFSIVKNFSDLEKLVKNFWDINIFKIKKFYLNNKQSSDIIISASPEFLLQEVANRLGFKLIATKVDINTGKLEGKNCYGKEKVKRLADLNIFSCEKFYSDSRTDLPCKKIAKHSFIVLGDEIIDWDEQG